jgi:hypothetical protein
LVPGLVPLGSALVQVAKMSFFTRILLGSWLGSTWFLLGSSLCEPQKSTFQVGGVKKMLGSIGPSCKNVIFHKDFAWFWAWFHLVPTWFQFV